jgi:hypothetical protein
MRSLELEAGAFDGAFSFGNSLAIWITKAPRRSCAAWRWR